MSLKKSKLTPIDFTKFMTTDAGNGEMFAALLGERVRFDHRRGRWLVWRNHRWEPDKDGEVYRLGKELCRQRFRAACQLADDDPHRKFETMWALRTESKYGMDAMLKAAQNELPVSDAGDWDSSPMLLGVANGVVDLRTGTLRDGLPSDRITLQSPVPFDAGAQCPRWEQFLREIFENKDDLIQFIHRAVGYSITGEVREHCFFLCHGYGSNGKTTYLEPLRYVLGDYADNVPFATFEKKQNGSASNDQAKLQGRRFVTAVEPNEQVRFNEGLLKLMTGGDAITARFLYKEFFTFHPVCKVWLAANHRPIVADDSHGFWRRVRMIPFNVKFADGTNIDKQLPDKLRAEAAGILAWAVRGCLEWQHHGLVMPEAVARATRGYQQESSPVDVFISECFVLDSQAWLSSQELWAMFQEWSRGNFDCHDLTRSQFAKRLKDRGLAPAQRGHKNTRGWKGLRPAVNPSVECEHANTANTPLYEVP